MKWFLLCLLTLRSLLGCTAFQLKTEDGAWIYGRSLEFSFRLNSNLVIIPRQTPYQGTAPLGKPGLTWTSRYGFVGMNQTIAPTHVSDGMNEQGLIVGALYLPGFAEYETPDPSRTSQTLGMWETPAFLLGTCSSVAEVKEALGSLLVAQQPLMGNFVLPLHLYVADKTGAVICVEYLNGKRTITDNPVGVLTNSPALDWHLTNLSNYINLSPYNVAPLTLSQWKARALGAGTGLLGLPGDYTPPSRFVKAALFSTWATPAKTALEGVKTAFHILNTFDIFDGIILPRKDNAPPLIGLPVANDITEWVIVHDRTHLKTYVRTYEGLDIEMVDINKIDFSPGKIRQIPLGKRFEPKDITLPK